MNNFELFFCANTGIAVFAYQQVVPNFVFSDTKYRLLVPNLAGALLTFSSFYFSFTPTKSDKSSRVIARDASHLDREVVCGVRESSGEGPSSSNLNPNTLLSHLWKQFSFGRKTQTVEDMTKRLTI